MMRRSPRSVAHARLPAPAGSVGVGAVALQARLATAIIDALRRSGSLSFSELAEEACRPRVGELVPIARWRMAAALGGLLATRDVVRLARPAGRRYGLAPGVREERCWVRPG